MKARPTSEPSCRQNQQQLFPQRWATGTEPFFTATRRRATLVQIIDQICNIQNVNGAPTIGIPGTSRIWIRFLGKKKVLSFGASFDIQPGVGGDEGDELFYAFADIPMGENGIASTLNAYYFSPDGIIPEGFGLWGDFGYRMKKIESLIAFEWYKPDEGDQGKRQAVLGGLNWWIYGHNVNIKLQFGVDKLNGADEWTKTAIVQSQVFF